LKDRKRLQPQNRSRLQYTKCHVSIRLLQKFTQFLVHFISFPYTYNCIITESFSRNINWDLFTSVFTIQTVCQFYYWCQQTPNHV